MDIVDEIWALHNESIGRPIPEIAETYLPPACGDSGGARVIGIFPSGIPIYCCNPDNPCRACGCEANKCNCRMVGLPLPCG